MEINDDLDALEALFEDETEINEESFVSVKQEPNNDSDGCVQPNEDLVSMEVQYRKLQEQMQNLQDKMKSKKFNQEILFSQTLGLTDTPSKNPKSVGATDNEKRSFSHAFGPTISNNEDTDLKDNDKNILPVIKNLEKSVNENCNSCSERFYPSQKKQRVSNCANEATYISKVHNQATIRNTKANRTKPKQPIQYEVEYFSRIRLKDRFIDAVEFKQRMDHKMFLKLSLLRPTLNISEEKDWVTIGVVAKQMDPQTAKNGKKFSIWQLTDLDDCSKHVALFLFGKMHEELWRNVTVGTVIGLLNPSIMPPKREPSSSGKNFDNSPALTIDASERLMKIGVSADLGWCTATKFRNKQPAGKCLAFINKQFGDVCVFHMQSKYKKISSKRGELQATSAPGVPAKYKHTLWNKVKGDQFFYGGQTFSAAPPTLNNAQPRKESKIKLTDVFSKCNSASSETQSSNVERSKIMQAVSGIDGSQTLSGCSDKFAEMLASGDAVAGSRQFLNHLQKKKALEDKSKTHDLTTSELTKQQKRSNDEKQSLRPSLSASVFLKEQMQSIKQSKPLNKSPTPNHLSIPKVSSRDDRVIATSDGLNDKTLSQTIVRSESSNGNSSPHPTPPGAINSTPSEVLLQMKRERYMKRNPPTSSMPRLLTPSSGQSSTPPQLGSGSVGKQIDLFGDWLSSKSKAPLSGLTLAELRKNKAIQKLQDGSGVVKIKNPDPNRPTLGMVGRATSSEKVMKLVKDRVDRNRADLSDHNKENSRARLSVLSSSKISSEEFDRILSSSSSHSDQLDLEEMQRQENYFNPLIKKEMMEMKMQQTYELSAKVVSCQQCQYTYWAPHDRCHKQNHVLVWKNVTKKFFECSNCKQRTTTWLPYPVRACRNCGNEKKWRKTSMMKEKEDKRDMLLVRGEEHSEFLNSMKNGTW